jgi:hypothetical protein
MFKGRPNNKTFGKPDEIKIYLIRELIQTFKMIFNSVIFGHIDITMIYLKITIE